MPKIDYKDGVLLLLAQLQLIFSSNMYKLTSVYLVNLKYQCI